jgi:hypothetical protein
MIKYIIIYKYPSEDKKKLAFYACFLVLTTLCFFWSFLQRLKTMIKDFIKSYESKKKHRLNKIINFKKLQTHKGPIEMSG